MTNYCAAIFDIIDSRKYEYRYDVQLVVKNSINYLNIFFANEIEKDVMFGAGDEFQGLFKNLEVAFLYARKLQLLIYPIKVRCGIGYGSVKYLNENWSSTETDGETYYNAREAMTSIPGKGSSVICFKIDDRFSKYINMYTLANAELKNRQSQTVKLIELLADIACPIINNKRWDRNEDEDFYKELIRLKVHLITQEKHISKRVAYDDVFMNLNINALYHACESSYTENSDPSSLFIDCYWERGLSSLIAEIISTSRQNVDKHIYLGRVKESRNMDRTIFMMLGERKW